MSLTVKLAERLASFQTLTVGHLWLGYSGARRPRDGNGSADAGVVVTVKRSSLAVS